MVHNLYGQPSREVGGGMSVVLLARKFCGLQFVLTAFAVSWNMLLVGVESLPRPR